MASVDQLQELIALSEPELLDQLQAAWAELQLVCNKRAVSEVAAKPAPATTSTPAASSAPSKGKPVAAETAAKPNTDILTQRAVLLEDLSLEQLKLLGPEVLTVYSTAKALTVLFEQLPESVTLRSLSVVLEDEEPCNAQQLLQMVMENDIQEDEPIQIDAVELRDVTAEIEAAATLGNLVDEIDAPLLGGGAADSAQFDIAPSAPAVDTQLDDEALGQFEQADLDALFADEDDDSGSAADDAAAANLELSQDELDALFADTSAGTAVTEAVRVAAATGEMLGQAELDDLFAAGSDDNAAGEDAANLELSQTELDALFAAGPAADATDADDAAVDGAGARLDQDELDALFAAGPGDGDVDDDATDADDVAVDSAGARLDQDELDALFAAGPGDGDVDDDATDADDAAVDGVGARLDQDELDALFAAGLGDNDADDDADADTAGTGAADSRMQLVQDELDALFAFDDPDADDTTQMNQAELDKLFAGSDDAVAVPAAAAEDTVVLDQDELDALFADAAPGAAKADPAAGRREKTADRPAAAPVVSRQKKRTT